MNRRIIITISAIAVAATFSLAGAAAASTSGDDSERPITGAALDRAAVAALAHTGQGRVTGTEVGDEDSFYEAEVTLDDGRHVDVQLDDSFQVVGVADDVEGEAGDE